MWQNEINFCLHSYALSKVDFSSFATRRMVGGWCPLLLKLKAKLTYLGNFQSIFSRSGSAVHVVKEVQLPIGSPLRTFQWAENRIRCLSPQRGFKNAKWWFLSILSKGVCYKVSLCENCQRQTCNAFTGLSIRARMVCGERPLERN